MTDNIKSLVERLRERAEHLTEVYGSFVPSTVPLYEGAADLLEQQAARITTLEQTLRDIANADTAEWDDRSEFEGWAKGRARGALGEGK